MNVPDVFSWCANDSFILVLSATDPDSVILPSKHNALVFQSASVVKRYMSSMKKKGEKQKSTIKWLSYCIRHRKQGEIKDKDGCGRTAQHLI